MSIWLSDYSILAQTATFIALSNIRVLLLLVLKFLPAFKPSMVFSRLDGTGKDTVMEVLLTKSRNTRRDRFIYLR
jgi:hypothetical protein